MRKILSFDFDGVIHEYSRGYHNGKIYDKPMKGAFEVLAKLLMRHNIFILSARPAEDILKWKYWKDAPFEVEIIPKGVIYWKKRGVIGITNTKLPAAVYFDDRAVRFTGNWRDVCNYYFWGGEVMPKIDKVLRLKVGDRE